MTRLWLRVIKEHRIAMQAEAECEWSKVKDVLVELCKQTDLPCPLWLNKQENEFKRFRRTSFLPEHFIESVEFDKLEIEYIDDTDAKRKSNDPRNQF